jgi:NADP-dependent 3-hydroxy acid dehydrogenase YdfG
MHRFDLNGKVAIVTACERGSHVPATYPEMKKSGGGKIINVGSMGSELAADWNGTYGASKAGMITFGRACSAAWGKIIFRSTQSCRDI